MLILPQCQLYTRSIYIYNLVELYIIFSQLQAIYKLLSGIHLPKTKQGGGQTKIPNKNYKQNAQKSFTLGLLSLFGWVFMTISPKQEQKTPPRSHFLGMDQQHPGH